MTFTLIQDAACEEEVRKSRFLALAAPVTTVEAAMDFIDRVSVPTATHNCWAWKLGNQYRFNDDGEPGGTAGRPILAAIEGQDCDQVVVVVIRWYGGIKLGTGGLVRAYSDAVSATLDAAPLVTRSRMALFEVAAPHAEAGRIESELRAAGVDIVDVSYGRAAAYTLAYAPGERDRITTLLAAVTHGGAEMNDAGHRWVERGR